MEFGCVSAGCPNHWIRYGKYCYLFVTRYPMEWIDAMTFCKTYGAILAEVKSSSVNTFLRHEARRLTGIFWLGGSDMFIERSWKWMSSNTRFYYSTWGHGEPNDSGGEHCVQLHSSFNYAWNDAKCQNRFNFICQKAA
ncbi:ladderlectin-like [Saccostrea echinata]|uniref:ladderlectin-like n=1 Tax=Saccostrea echinata TaxID=191078 RepID=UPI002A80BC28|nr:ladderlectin-like [Saccostrea echinata]